VGDRDREHDGPARAGRDLAELADRLRRSVGGGDAPAAGAWSSRFAALAAAWGCFAEENADPGCAALADALVDLAAALDGSPVVDGDGRLELTRHDLALGRLIARCDAAGVASVTADADAWQDFGARPAPDSGAPAAAAAPARQPGPVILLVASPFLRDTLAARLAGAGRSLVTAAGVDEARALLRRAPDGGLVLCDNEEPTNHLRRLRSALGGAPAGRVTFVLVAAGSDANGGQSRRAQAVGADAVWAEPWRPEHLARLGSPAGAGGIS